MKQRFFSEKMTNEILRPEFSQFNIEVKYSNDNVAIMYKGKSFKPLFHYRFQSTEKMMSYVNQVINKVITDEQNKIEYKATKKAADAAANALDFYKVGDIILNSWGYDQTNCDFYQVTKMTAKTITILAINSELVPGSDGFMCGKVLPLVDNFDKSERSFTLKVKAGGQLSNPEKFYNFRKVAADKEQYCSWYA